MNFRIYKSDEYDEFLDTEAGMFLSAEVVEDHAQVYSVSDTMLGGQNKILIASYPPGAWDKLIAVEFDQ